MDQPGNYRDYYLMRAATSRQLAARAVNVQIAAIHVELATRYDELAMRCDRPGESGMMAAQAA